MSIQSIPNYDSPREDRVLTRDEVKARFDHETAAVYSQDSPVYLPDFANAFALVIRSAEGLLPDPLRFLDLGAGTGNLSRRMLEARPGSHGTLVDFSPNMLEGTRVVLAAYPGHYDTVCGDFFTVELPDQSFDMVISSFALHHARGRDEYLQIYRQVRRWLKPGGVFTCCDVVSGDHPQWTALNEQGWKDYLRRVDFSEEQIERIFASYHVEDTPTSLFQHLTLLHEAGFEQADVLWKQYNFAVYCAR